jgi:hypothetical protein
MSVTVICQGCGHSFPTGPGYQKNKIQCPACGVICPVPQGPGPAGRRGGTPAARKDESGRQPGWAPEEPDPAPYQEPAARRPVPDQEEDDLLRLLIDGSAPAPPPPAQPAAARSAPPDPPREVDARPPATRPPPPPELPFNCRRCGRKVRRQGECPDCNARPPVLVLDPDAPPGAPTATAPVDDPPVVPRLELDETPLPAPPAYDPEEDEDPYLLADRDYPVCPGCRKTLPPGGVVCPSCGFDQRKQKKVARTWDPLARAWDTNYSLTARLHILVASVAGVLILGLAGTSSAGLPWGPFLTSWLVFVVFLTFLLGTFERIELTRDRKGRATLTQTWRYFFVPVPPRRTEVRGFGSISTGQEHEAGFWEWLIFVSLIWFGVVPAIIWWYQAIHKANYFVALTRDHGYPAHYAYRGRSEEQMREIATTLREASGLTWDS